MAPAPRRVARRFRIRVESSLSQEVQLFFGTLNMIRKIIVSHIHVHVYMLHNRCYTYKAVLRLIRLSRLKYRIIKIYWSHSVLLQKVEDETLHNVKLMIHLFATFTARNLSNESAAITEWDCNSVFDILSRPKYWYYVQFIAIPVMNH